MQLVSNFHDNAVTKTSRDNIRLSKYRFVFLRRQNVEGKLGVAQYLITVLCQTKRNESLSLK